jgi:multidrug efflux pump
VVPLLLASGAGAVSRFAMGLVIFTGISIGTLFTLFVVPAMYLLLGEDHQTRRERDRERGAAGLPPPEPQPH